MSDGEQTKKQYVKPEVIHELELETRAGTPAGIIDLSPLDLTSEE